MRESSLDDFLGDESETDAVDSTEPAVEADSDAAPDDGPDGDDELTDSNTADAVSATTTYAWSTEGVDCADCGSTVTRRWRDGDKLVCASCKSW